MRKRFERVNGMISWKEQEYLICTTLKNEDLRVAVIEKIQKEEGDYDRDDLVSLFTEYDEEHALTFYQLLDTAASDKAIAYIEAVFRFEEEDSLEKDYEEYKKLQKEYHEGNEEQKALAREKYRAWKERLEAKGKEYGKVYSLYEEAKERGNERIDICEAVWEKDAADLIASLRKYGIKEFTFSSGWSSAVEIAWLFLQAGCELKGMVEINTRYRDFMTCELERAHGYLFRIKEA